MTSHFPRPDCDSSISGPHLHRLAEAFLEPKTPLSFPSNIRSLALMLWRVAGQSDMNLSFLFDHDEVIADLMDVLGPLPLEWWEI
ncbi:hypothetical protein PspLS_09176 [Pyricularia sp. CBS 133598]|nr:hypothetical protein PspLS_09176 [Pyricularia sp. CBS 133598]